ncbi:MAG: sporulation protein YtfJ [Clostridiaceae bacterium]|nr:sporulation protein YtfJ [Clostridiaceae bacterium]
MQDTMSKIKEMVDVNTIVGDPIATPDGVTLIPVSRVSFGFASGGADGGSKGGAQQPVRFGAGSGAGVTISPVAFIVLSGGNARILYVDPPANSAVDRIIDLAPQLMDKFKEMKDGRS